VQPEPGSGPGLKEEKKSTSEQLKAKKRRGGIGPTERWRARRRNQTCCGECLHIREALQEANLIKANSKLKKFKFKI
jgi:hypothetical protein